MTADTVRLEFKRPAGSVADSGIEVATHPTGHGTVVRASGDPYGPTLVLEAGQWRRLIANVKRSNWPANHFAWDDPGREHVSMRVPGDDTILRFTASEMAAFERAALRGEFDLRRKPAST